MQVNNMFGSEKSDNKMSRYAMIFCTVLAVGSSLYSYTDSRNFIASRSDRKVVIDRNNRAWLATEKELTEEQKIIQVKEHVRDFYKLFYAFNAGSFDTTVNRALNLMEAGAGKKLYIKEYVEGKIARKVKEGNWSVEVAITKIDVEPGVYPFRGKVYALQTVVRAAGRSTRNLNADFEVMTIGVSEEKPRGYIITVFEPFDTSIKK